MSDSYPELHIEMEESDVALHQSKAQGYLRNLLMNPVHENVLAQCSSRGLAIWSASDSPSI